MAVTRAITDLIAGQAVVAPSYTLQNGQLILTTGTITTSKPGVDITQTWNAGAVAFTGIKLNITDTASAAASLLLDLQVGGASSFAAGKNFDVFLRGTSGIRLASANASTLDFYGSGTTLAARLGLSRFSLASELGLGSAASPNVFILSDAANTLALRNAANAQSYHLYGTYTDASNYRRLLIGSTTAGVFSITPVGAGTGAAGNVLHISGLPTSNPGAGILWNNAGTPAIGT